MVNPEIKSILKELNFSEKEIEVYLALLMSGSLRVNDLSKRAKLNRITTYHILKSLLEKGIVSYITKSKVKYFQATDPKKMFRILKEKEEKLSKILPELEEIKESILEHPQVEIYEGKEGLKSIMDDWISQNKEIIGIGSEDLDKVLEFYFPNFINRRVKQKVKIRLMFNKSKYALDMQKRDKKELRETKMLDCEKLTTGIYIYGNKASFLTFSEDEPLGLVIEDKFIVKTIKVMLELLWKSAKK